MHLEDLGWSNFFQQHINSLDTDSLVPARVAEEHKQLYQVFTAEGDLRAEVTGRFLHNARDRGDFPVVGDWVAVKIMPDEGKAIIHELLPRKSVFSRKVAGEKTEEQPVAANIDTLFLVSGLDNDFNIRRLERYLTLAWDCGASPVIVLNKVDLCDNPDDFIDEISNIAFGLPVHTVSAAEGKGLEVFDKYLGQGQTAAFLGSSGVGKSTLINRLLGTERQLVKDVSEFQSKGRHTTTSRELILLPQGGLVIDTPGMRELQLWTDESGLEQTFDDIKQLAAKCRFRDCRHVNEPGCAIIAALENGDLDEARWRSYLKLQKELKFLAHRKDLKSQRQTQRDFAKKIRQYHQGRKFLRKKGMI